MKILKPPRLRRGDVIGLISPASAPLLAEKIEKGVRYLERLGYRVKLGEHVAAQRGYFAGTDAQRLSDLNAMLNDPQVKAIFAIRGGYGSPRLLPFVDYRAVRRQPKIFAGPLATPVPKGLDRLLEATLLWPIVRGAISRPLHPLRGYLQPSPDLVC